MSNYSRPLLTYLTLAFFALLVTESRSVAAAPVEKCVRVIYLVPKDREAREDYKKALERCVLDLQVWYYGHLKGRTFRLNSPIVEVERTGHEAAWYDSHEPANKPGQKFNTWYNVLDEARELVGAKPDDKEFVWFIYIDAPGGTGAGVRGVAILPEHDLVGLIGKASDGTPVSRWIGGGGHEVGHAFGLPHPGDEFPMALMQFGYTRYPACYLTPTETRSLLDSPFFFAETPKSLQGRGRSIYLYRGGYFLATEGDRWEEHKTGEETILKFVARKEEAGYRHLLDASRPPGAWIALPNAGKGNDILFRWEGEEWRKIYEAE